jgi:hypothetical protein
MIIVISYSGPGLSDRVARSRSPESTSEPASWYIMVDSCWSWLYLLVVFIWSSIPMILHVSLSTSLLHITPSTTKVAIFRPVWTPEQASCLFCIALAWFFSWFQFNTIGYCLSRMIFESERYLLLPRRCFWLRLSILCLVFPKQTRA